MNSDVTEPLNQLPLQDKEELTRLLYTLELREGATTILAIAPDISPAHPVIKQFQERLQAIAESFRVEPFHYSDRAFYEFLYSSETEDTVSPDLGRRLVMIYGLDQLPTPRLVREMDQLNRGREVIAKRNLVLIFWLNKADFLDEFRSRAPDFWDWRGKVVMFQTRPSLNPLFYPYLEWLIAENSYLKMSGIMQVNRQVDLFLDQIYVSLQAERRQQVTQTSRRERQQVAVTRRMGRSRVERMEGSGIFQDDEPIEYESIELEIDAVEENTKTVVERVDLASVVQNHTYSVILGAPGAGKTTLLRYLALHYAKAKRDGIDQVVGGSQEELGAIRLPIFIRIADYAERLEDEPDLSLLEYFQQFYRQWEAAFETTEIAAVRATFPELLLTQMRQGNCLMLLDGLDEVFDQKSRQRVVQGIDAFVEEFAGGESGNRFVVTSRIAGYRDVQLSSRFQEFTIAEMAEAQVEQFLRRWCRAIEEAQQPEAGEAQWGRQADTEVRAILQAIGTSEGVKRLTVNPLLLTILALIHRNGSRLPERRVDLYKLAVKTLTEDWQLGKKLPDAPKLVVKENEAMELLAPLAYWMHEEKPSGVVTQAEAEQQLAKTLAELNRVSPEAAEVRQAVDLFLRKVRETTGLFVERAPAVYGFMHLTFEEYFAARHIANNDREEILQLIRAHLYEPRWEEPILLALGYCSHTPRLIDRLVEDLFRNLEDYQPRLTDAAIKLKRAGSPDAVLIWTAADNPAREVPLMALGFAGKVLAEVDISGGLHRRLWEKLAVTYLLLDTGLDDDTTQGFLRLLRRIDVFNRKSEVADYFKQVVKDVSLSQKLRVRAQVAVLYICSSEAGNTLRDCVTELASQFAPELFNSIRDLVTALGEEMSPSLEATCRDCAGDVEQESVLRFFVALSYIRAKQYEKAISQFDNFSLTADHRLSAYIAWSLAVCHQEQENYEKANDYYQTCFEQLAPLIEPNAFLMYWRNRGVCQRLYEKWEKALDCFQQMLDIARNLKNSEEEALALHHIGRTHQEWKKYDTAITYHQQSRDLYQQIEREKSVGWQWDWLSDCYRDWEKYEQALKCQQERLRIYEQIEEQSEIASVYYAIGRIYQTSKNYKEAIAHHEQSRDRYQQLGKEENVASQVFCLGNCYQAWGKYEEAIAHYQQSRDRYQQLDKEKDVANLWYWMAACYCDWGKYELALEAERQDLVICQKLDDQSGIALACWQLGSIYQAWDKYEEAIAHYQQSRDRYQQLDKEKDVANLWYRMAACYRDWGKYKLALAAEQQDLAIRQKLDDQSNIAHAYWQLGHIYQSWGKYEEAIAHYQQSCDRYQQLDKETNVANQWYWMAVCYREWGKYNLALEAEQQDLTIRQKLDDQSNIADAYCQLGRIYQAWGKYEEAIVHHEQSRDRYQQLGQEKEVSYRWYNLASCYREWGKYEKALACEQKDLELCQKLDLQADIALSHYQLGRIYQAWGRYEEAIAHHQQSRDRYQQLGKKEDVANQVFWLGNCYQAWGKYEEAITHYQQSRDRYQQLDKEKDAADQWSWIAYCYCEWGKYKLALAAEQQDLVIRQKLDDQSNIADAYRQLGRIYQSWGKYEEAIAYYQQSRDRYEALDLQQDVANLLSWLATCYRDLKDYATAIDYYRHSVERHRAVGNNESVAKRLRQLSNIQRQWAKTCSSNEVETLLQQAEENLQQAIQLDTTGDYRENLAYDQISLALLTAESLRWGLADAVAIPNQIDQFEQWYIAGFTRFTELGQIVDRAEEALDIARVYLEISALENLDRAEKLTRQSLQTFRDFNQRKLQASAYKLLGEIDLKRAGQGRSQAILTAEKSLLESLQLYRDLTLTQDAEEVEQLLQSIGKSGVSSVAE